MLRAKSSLMTRQSFSCPRITSQDIEHIALVCDGVLCVQDATNIIDAGIKNFFICISLYV